MSNVQIFDTTFALAILVILAIAVPLLLLFANWILHPGKIKQTLIKGTAYECGLAHVAEAPTNATRSNTTWSPCSFSFSTSKSRFSIR